MPGLQDDLYGVYRVIRDAEQKLLALRKESKQELPPIVKAGAPCVWKEDHWAWFLHFPIHTTLREVWFGESMLYEVPSADQHPFTVHLYLKPPVGAKYPPVLGNVFTEEGVTMPHIDAGGACMNVAIVPETLLTLQDYEALEAILTRHCQGINLMSLYTSNTNYWPQGIMASLPKEIVEWLEWDDSDNKKPAIRHLFKSVANTEWLAEPVEPEYSAFSEEDEDAESEDAIHLCNCETCRAIRAEANQQVEDELPPLRIQTQIAQTQGASLLWQIQSPLGDPPEVDPNEIWRI